MAGPRPAYGQQPSPAPGQIRTQVACSGQVISDISVLSLPPSYGGVISRTPWMNRAATSIHMTTEPHVVENLVLLKKGAPCSALLRLETEQAIFGKLDFALNDFTVVKKDTSAMITIHTFIDGEFLNSYWADGIIVSTPTGSTGYSLSCGGPLIFPRSGNFVLTPVSPHNLTVRPIIVSDTSEISFQVDGRSKKFLVSLDSRIATVDNTVKLRVKKADFIVNLIQLEGHHYFKTLRQKLNWGLDVRN